MRVHLKKIVFNTGNFVLFFFFFNIACGVETLETMVPKERYNVLEKK